MTLISDLADLPLRKLFQLLEVFSEEVGLSPGENPSGIELGVRACFVSASGPWGSESSMVWQYLQALSKEEGLMGASGLGSAKGAWAVEVLEGASAKGAWASEVLEGAPGKGAWGPEVFEGASAMGALGVKVFEGASAKGAWASTPWAARTGVGSSPGLAPRCP